MGKRLTGVEASRIAPVTSPPAFPRQQRWRVPVPHARRAFGIIAPLLCALLVLAGCQDRGSGDNREHRDGFYGGVTGGVSRP